LQFLFDDVVLGPATAEREFYLRYNLYAALGHPSVTKSAFLRPVLNKMSKMLGVQSVANKQVETWCRRLLRRRVILAKRNNADPWRPDKTEEGASLD